MKKLVIIMAALIMSMAMLVGCTGSTEDAQATDSQEPVSTEAESEVNSEEESEVVSEDISEEVSEEVVVDYSAEAVMDLIDDLIAKYPNENPEHIKSAVIGANIDYIAEEDLNTILTAYGYTLEELNVLFGEYAKELKECFELTYYYRHGDIEPEVIFEDRMSLDEVMMNPEDYEYTLLGYDIYDDRYEHVGEIAQQCNNIHQDAVADGTLTSGMKVSDVLWIDPASTPYDKYINAN